MNAIAKQSALIRTFDVSAAGETFREFLLTSDELSRVTPYERPSCRFVWLPKKDFCSEKINHLLGQALERALPPQVTSAIQNLSLGELPLAIHLKGMPTGQPDSGKPEIGFPFCAMTLRAISALLAKRDSEWDNAGFARRFTFESNNDTKLQKMHCDYVITEEPYGIHGPVTLQNYSILHYIKTDGATPTWISPYNKADTQELPDEERHLPVVAESGDVLILNNLRTIHARGLSPMAKTPNRHFVALNGNYSYAPHVSC